MNGRFAHPVYRPAEWTRDVDGPTLVTCFFGTTLPWRNVLLTSGITVQTLCRRFLITTTFLMKGKKGFMLWGILVTWILGIPSASCAVCMCPDPRLIFIPLFRLRFGLASMASTFMKMDFSYIGSHTADFLVVFAFYLSISFDTIRNSQWLCR